MNSYYDIIIIGTGSGGSTMAYKLAPSGKSILVLERGGFIPKEKENWDARQVVAAGRYRPNDEWLDMNGHAFKPFIHYNVGGNSKMYGAAMFRFRESDFEEVRHYGGISPEWPLKYGVYEPYYTMAEQLYTVHGKRGTDPTEPWTRAEYPLPPLPYEPLITELNEKLLQLGLKPFPLPMGMRLPQDYTRTEAPVLLENFDGFPDPTDSKADGHVAALRPALQHGNIHLVTHAYVERLVTDPDGKRVTKVEMDIRGEKKVVEGGIVIVACGAVNSAALFLRSRSKRYPTGLANSSGLVGRNLMLHHNGCLVAFLRQPINDCVFQKSLGIADFYHSFVNDSFPLGEIQLMGRNDPDTIMWLAEKVYPGKPYEELKRLTLDFWLTAEDLPDPENRVELTKENRIQVFYRPTNFPAYERLKEKLKEVMHQVGRIDPRFADIAWAGYDLDISGMSHQNGTLRFGDDPARSVLDLNCRTHDVENLYVVDASFFPSCGAFNPSLTIAANALRVGDHILGEILGITQGSNLVEKEEPVVV